MPKKEIKVTELEILIAECNLIKKIIHDDINKKSYLDKIALVKSIKSKDVASFALCISLSSVMTYLPFAYSPTFTNHLADNDGIAGAAYGIAWASATFGWMGMLKNAFNFNNQPLSTLSQTDKINQFLLQMHQQGLLKDINATRSIDTLLTQINLITNTAHSKINYINWEMQEDAHRLKRLQKDLNTLKALGMFSKPQTEANVNDLPDLPSNMPSLTVMQ